jgi:hypothetical protein
LTGTPADNADALRRVDDTVHKEAVRSIFDNKPGSPESSSK